MDWTEDYQERAFDTYNTDTYITKMPPDDFTPEVCPLPYDALDPLDPMLTGPNWYDGGDDGGYPGGPTPGGFTDYGDGTGRFMYDNQGRLHVNPNYAQWLNSPDQQINWLGVFTELAAIAGTSIGLLPFNGAVVLVSWMSTWIIGLISGDEFKERVTED